ncbi:translation initiation factor IF-2 [Nocardioidaceae bacterium Broad-1]|nr:translation initiation factor IF-2 [Nocardioidaceae bacterium Broad-1]
MTPLEDLLDELEAAGVKVPDEVGRVREWRVRLGELTAAARGESDSVDVLHLSDEELLGRAREHAVTEAVARAGRSTRLDEVGAAKVLTELAGSARRLLAGQVEDLLDQLRPEFDAAAGPVHAAAAAGIQPGQRAADVIDDDEAVEHWRAVRHHVPTLERIGRLRIRLSEVLGVPPVKGCPPGPYGCSHHGNAQCPQHPPAYGAAFTVDGRGWDPRLGSHDRWLALNGGPQPAALLSVDQTRKQLDA